MQRELSPYAGRRAALNDDSNTVADWVPAVDIVEEKDRYVLRADVPGVKPENIDVNMENGVLTVSGERHHESTEAAEGMRRVERVSGKFYRRFNLPDTADAEEISAKSANGILEVRIPKQPEVQARRITVESA
jgi:HSP20 family protein